MKSASVSCKDTGDWVKLKLKTRVKESIYVGEEGEGNKNSIIDTI